MTEHSNANSYDVLIIGGGAAGLMAAVLLSRQSPELKIAILDGAKRLGAKILISGGGRCNVTNVSVTAKDFHGGSRNVIKRTLKAFSAKETVKFFAGLGVELHEEEHGKLFPDSNKARTVLEALIESAESQGVHLLTDQRVEAIEKQSQQFSVQTQQAEFSCRRVILATGGRSIPKTGSDGFGYELARSLGHTMTSTLPALAPMLLNGDFHEGLSGISLETELTLKTKSNKPVKFTGSMLWTHFGISGPVALNVSRHWHAADSNGDGPVVSANFLPEMNSHQFEETLLQQSQTNSNSTIRKYLSTQLPNRFVDSMLHVCDIPADLQFSALKKEQRKKLVQNLTEYRLPISNSRGFGFAEATAGGIPLSEINPSTMESRCCSGLYLVGEILDVDGKLGGYNFQWAWSSAAVAARGVGQSND